MAYVQPNTVVELFADIGLTENYDNCLYFDSIASKDAYFDSLPKIATLNDLSYSRQQRGFIRSGHNIKDIYNAGYMRFKNSDFENKWFYAFIDSVEYIANGTTQINFTIDVMTTWMGAFSLNQCFIERQHVVNDSIGANIADEGLQLGSYIIENVNNHTYGNFQIVIVTASEKGGTGGGLRGGIYSGCEIKKFTQPDEANSFIQGLIDANKADNIVNIYMSPLLYNTENPNNYFSEDISYPKPYSSLDGYVPKNNKLFCYPYKFVEVTNSEGDRKEYMYEYFKGGNNYEFHHEALAGAQTQASIIPKQYKTNRTGFFQTDERVSISSFPLCSYNVDTYKAYIAQVNSNLPVNAFSAMANGALSGGLTGGLIGAVNGALSSALPQVLNALSANLVRPEMGTKNNGTQESDLLSTIHAKGFLIYEKCITNNYASMIDDFFTMFGYAVRNTGTPNMNARPYFTYVKTVDCSIKGKLPCDDARKIENIFNTGVRFWKNHTNIGNYNLDNSPS